MPPFGVIECFYGLAWSPQDREFYAHFLRQIGFQFYIYGPKADESLRRNWSATITAQESEQYRLLRAGFAAQGLRFGMALSPQGLYQNMDLAQRHKLQEKVKALTDIGIDYLGLFFDDMKSAPDMAEKQLEIIDVVARSTTAKLLFCPSYYCNDSLLDLLFGDRPAGYLEALGSALPAEIEVLWTGEEIISREITAEQLQTVAQRLKRKPFICDNFLANDGPMNCDFLRILPPTGRTREVFSEASGWAFNPMNQAHLSKIAIQAFAHYAKDGLEPESAFARAIQASCRSSIAELILSQYKNFSEQGLSEIPDAEKTLLRKALQAQGTAVEKELLLWLDGHYAVGLESIIEQSCFEGT